MLDEQENVCVDELRWDRETHQSGRNHEVIEASNHNRVIDRGSMARRQAITMRNND